MTYSDLVAKVSAVTGMNKENAKRFVTAELLIYVAYQLGERSQVVHKNGGTIEITWKEVVDAARDMDIATKQEYRVKVLCSSKFLNCTGQEVVNIHIDGRVNLLGQVGAGKSTFSEPLALALSRKGYRVLFLEQTIPKIHEKVKLFKKMGVRAVGIISHLGESRRKHAEALSRGNGFPYSGMSEMIETGCPLQVFVTQSEKVIPI